MLIKNLIIVLSLKINNEGECYDKHGFVQRV